jgi:cobaltochelatase CobN
VLAFLNEHNPAALKEMSERLIESQDRGLWKPRLNSTYKRLRTLAGEKEAAAE